MSTEPSTATILFIEDDENYAEAIITILKHRHKIDVIWVKNPSEVRELLKTTRVFDLIITDIELPEYNGDFIAKVLNIEGILDDTPLLISSGLYDEVYLEHISLSKDLANCFYLDFCEKGKPAWLIFKIQQLIKLKYQFKMFGRA
jgi:CheY-like chemotaxis protein